MIVFEALPEFDRDIKKLKKFRSIEEDLEKFKSALIAKLSEDISSTLPGTEEISGLGAKVKTPIFKVRHFRCQFLKGKGSRSGIRIIYALKLDEKKVILVEIYHKNKKDKEDRGRILKWFCG